MLFHEFVFKSKIESISQENNKEIDDITARMKKSKEELDNQFKEVERSKNNYYSFGNAFILERIKKYNPSIGSQANSYKEAVLNKSKAKAKYRVEYVF